MPEGARKVGPDSSGPDTIVIIFRRNLLGFLRLPHFAHMVQPWIGACGMDRVAWLEFAIPVLQGFPDLTLERV